MRNYDYQSLFPNVSLVEEVHEQNGVGSIHHGTSINQVLPHLTLVIFPLEVRKDIDIYTNEHL